MKIIDVLTSPWAIVPDKLFEIQKIYATHLRGEKIDIKSIEAKIGKPLNNEPLPYQMFDNMAVINIHGVIAKRMNLFSQISGGVSTQQIGQDLLKAFDDPGVAGILLDVDSPGGSVDGTQDLADVIYKNRDKKPVITFSDGMAASAAYWIGSAAHEMYISSDTVHVGAIGVVAAHADYSQQDEALGIKTTEIYAGKYKRIASSHLPLTEEGKQSIQDQVDYIYSVFVEQVAKHRGVGPGSVIENMADGKIFIGRQAIEAGLVDGVTTFTQALERLSVLQSGTGINNFAKQSHKEEHLMEITMEVMAEDAPELLAQIQADANKTGHDKGVEEGVNTERERVASVLAVEEADDASKKKAISEGLSVDASYKLFFEAEKSKKAEELAALEKSGADSVGQQGQEHNSDNPETFMSAVDLYQKENKCTRTVALQAVAKARPALHETSLTKKEE